MSKAKTNPLFPKETLIVYPFDSAEFMAMWEAWKKHRKAKKVPYLIPEQEQATLKRIAKLSNGNEDYAIEMIEHCISSGYQGIFPLSNNTNNGNTTNKSPNLGRYSNLENELANGFRNAGGN